MDYSIYKVRVYETHIVIEWFEKSQLQQYIIYA